MSQPPTDHRHNAAIRTTQSGDASSHSSREDGPDERWQPMAGKEHARRVLVLERRRLLLGLTEVTLAPSRFHGWRRQAISIRYSDIVAIENVAPEPGNRAALTLRLRDGEVIAVAYPRRSELRMRSIRHQLQKRVRAAREAG